MLHKYKYICYINMAYLYSSIPHWWNTARVKCGVAGRKVSNSDHYHQSVNFLYNQVVENTDGNLTV